MLHLKAVFERKTNEFPASDCVIEKLVELPKEEYLYFRNHLIQDADFIADSKDSMYVDKNSVQHCLLVLGQNSTEGILVQSEGYDYARYASLLPGARDFVKARLSELADHIIKEGTQNTGNGSWAVYFDKLEEQYGINFDPSNGIGSMLLSLLEARPEISEIEPMEDGFDMSFYLDYCQNLDEGSVRQEPEQGPQMNM